MVFNTLCSPVLCTKVALALKGSSKMKDEDKERGVTILSKKSFQASTRTQTVTGPEGPVTPRVYWSCKMFTGPTKFSLSSQEKNIA